MSSIFPDDVCSECVIKCFEESQKIENSNFASFTNFQDCLSNNNENEQRRLMELLFCVIYKNKHMNCFKQLCDYGWFKICFEFVLSPLSFDYLIFDKQYYCEELFEFIIENSLDIIIPYHNGIHHFVLRCLQTCWFVQGGKEPLELVTKCINKRTSNFITMNELLFNEVMKIVGILVRSKYLMGTFFPTSSEPVTKNGEIVRNAIYFKAFSIFVSDSYKQKIIDYVMDHNPDLPDLNEELCGYFRPNTQQETLLTNDNI